MIQGIKNDGMNLTDFESKVKTLKVSFIKRLLDDNPGKLKKLANHFYNTQDLDFYFKGNHKDNPKIEPLVWATASQRNRFTTSFKPGNME